MDKPTARYIMDVIYGFRGGVITVLLILITFTAQAQSDRKAELIEKHRLTQEQPLDLHSVGKRFHAWRQSNEILRRHAQLGAVKGLTIEQILAWETLFTATPALVAHWDTGSVSPIYLSGHPLQRSMSFALPGMHHERTVRAFFHRFAELLAFNGNEEALRLLDAQTDALGRTHLRFGQLRHGLPVIGKEAICGITPAGDMDLFMGRLAADALPSHGSFVLTPSAALTAATSHIESMLHAHGHEADETLPWDSTPIVERAYAEHDNALFAVYSLELRPTPFDRWHCLIDAESGEVLSAYNSVCAGGPAKAQAMDLHGQTRTIDTYDHEGLYFMIDASRPMFNAQSVFPDEVVGAIQTLNANNTDLTNVTHVTSQNNTWSDASSVSAHYNAGLVYEYYRTTHGRNSFDDKGSTMYSIVNVTQNSQSMGNAFWNGRFVSYGNGDDLFTQWAIALDMATHEFTHAVTEHTAGLEYKFQSGALNEAFSDIFGAMVDRENWTIGEDFTPVSQVFPSGALRDLSDPHNGAQQGSPAWQPRHMNEYQDLPITINNGGVHRNSGIPNHAAYLLAMQIGRDKAERILYRALSTKLTRQARFIDFRLAIIRSAEELYGPAEAEACASACDQVGITDGTGTKTPGDLPAVDGIDRMLFVNTDLFLPAPLWIVTPPGTNQNDFSAISYSGIWSKPSVTDDGSVAAFIDDEFNLRVIALTGDPNEQVIDASGVWNSVAVSPDGNILALTSIMPGAAIHAFDLSGPVPVANTFTVYTPTYSSADFPNTANFVDAMDFSLDGSTLLFDTYNELRVGGTSYGFWDINTLDIWDAVADDWGSGRIDRIFPQNISMNIGNPIWARTKPSVIAFDVQSPATSEAAVMAMNILDGTPRLVAEIPAGSFGYPTYSGNDAILSYVNNESIHIVFNAPMGSDGITVTGSPQGFVAEATFPVWFRTGSRPVTVEAVAALPAGMELEQNYPNPFAASTYIRFTVDNQSHTTLSIHDLLGRRLVTLADGVLAAGAHTVAWNGRDADGRALPAGMYLYRLTGENGIISKRMILTR
jgi:bacillolysin